MTITQPSPFCQSAGRGHATAAKLRADPHRAESLTGQPLHLVGAHHYLGTAPDAAFLPCSGKRPTRKRAILELLTIRAVRMRIGQ